MFIEELQNGSVVENTKGGLYYSTTFNKNLDLFVMATRYQRDTKINSLFNHAYSENKTLCAANILYNLDIRDGKGERRVFKALFKNLINKDISLADKVLKLIPEYGRYDYLLEAINTPLEENAIEIIKNQINKDVNTNNPSLLGKWMPSLRTHNKNNKMAYYLCNKFGYKPKEYRLLLKGLRDKINIVEHNLTNKAYDNINYEHVPSKAMLKYRRAFYVNDEVRYREYLCNLKHGNAKINANLFPYEIIKEVLKHNDNDMEALDLLWKNQKDVLNGDASNVLVMADTSGSMFTRTMLPITSALSLAIYLAERNEGAFKNMFLNFSDNPTLQILKGNSIYEKIASLNMDNWNGTTDINKAMDLILKATLKAQSEAPTHLVIISDMEFDGCIVGKTNLEHWQDEYQKHNLTMPKIVFWCVNDDVKGIPITKNNNNVCAISGYSPNVFKNILTMENFKPVEEMINILKPYIDLIEND